MSWINFKGEDKVYPPEGVDVIIGDDLGNEDIAYYILSGEYVWLTFDDESDDSKLYDKFIPTKWKHIKE